LALGGGRGPGSKVATVAAPVWNRKHTLAGICKKRVVDREKCEIGGFEFVVGLGLVLRWVSDSGGVLTSMNNSNILPSTQASCSGFDGRRALPKAFATVGRTNK